MILLNGHADIEADRYRDDQPIKTIALRLWKAAPGTLRIFEREPQWRELAPVMEVSERDLKIAVDTRRDLTLSGGYRFLGYANQETDCVAFKLPGSHGGIYEVYHEELVEALW